MQSGGLLEFDLLKGQDENVYASAMDNGDYLSETDYLGTLLTNAALQFSPGESTLIESECIGDIGDWTDTDYETFANIEQTSAVVISSTERAVAEYLPWCNDLESQPSPSSSATSMETTCSSTTLTKRRGTRKPKMYESDIPTDDPKRQKRIINAKKAKMNREEKKLKEREQEKKCEELQNVNKRAALVIKTMRKRIDKMTQQQNHILKREEKKCQENKELKEMMLSIQAKIEMAVDLSDPGSRVGKALSRIVLDITEHMV
ncbi:uncharacterized protein LOC143024637 isoform X2 [Oratosquilla oratoria]|uniref:uncharacterized protein LOC143024637 isoform X2 n=1 Tax=Oratosquilla oratoria TaxID=337810 RepID=UPI003F7768E1